jgi:hypothetical protein
MKTYATVLLAVVMYSVTDAVAHAITVKPVVGGIHLDFHPSFIFYQKNE